MVLSSDRVLDSYKGAPEVHGSPTPNRNSANRRSRQERRDDNRSSMEGYSQLNKMSESASQGLDPNLNSAPRSVPPKSNSHELPHLSDSARRREKS